MHDEAAEAIRGLIERILLTSGERRGVMDAALHGDLSTILEWAGDGSRKGAKDIPRVRMSVSVVAGAGLMRQRSKNRLKLYKSKR